MGLRVGLTGGLGSGKSTVAARLREHGAYVLSADEIGRKLMEPGRAVHAAIVGRFGEGVLQSDGTLNRAELSRLAFVKGRVEELNSIVHPAAIRLQGEITAEILRRDPDAIVVVESALIFETKYGDTKYGDSWRERFDRMILVTAPEELKIARFATRAAGGDRAALEAEAARRLALMIPDEVKIAECDFVIANDCTLDRLRAKADAVWELLLDSSAEETSV